jgi:hypothetical protein
MLSALGDGQKHPMSIFRVVVRSSSVIAESRPSPRIVPTLELGRERAAPAIGERRPEGVNNSQDLENNGVLGRAPEHQSERDEPFGLNST